MHLPVNPPVKPMLAKVAPAIPIDQLYEPKWDGFRSIIFRDGDEIEIGSRNERPMTRYFPELVEAVKNNFPERAVIDGEIILIGPDGTLDFEGLQQRIHPAESRVNLLAQQTPASFVAFDLLAAGDDDLTAEPFSQRRDRLVEILGAAQAPIYVTPLTADHETAERWFNDFEGAGLDGVIAKKPEITYQPDKRVMTKIKHQRTADCVVAGYRRHKSDPEAIGSLLLGLYNDAGELSNVGVIGSFPMQTRKDLYVELQPLVTDLADHPWNWAEQIPVTESGSRSPTKSAGSRWNNGKDLSFTPLQPQLVVEVRYDYMEGSRFRHVAQFNRWRPDRDPLSCTFDQLQSPEPIALKQLFTD